MTATLTVRDKSTSGQTLRSTTIELPTEQVTVEDLIRSYVYQHVKDSNTNGPDAAGPAPLVEPALDEVMLNGVKSTAPAPTSWQAEFDKTKHAFQRHQILVFVNDQQMNSLDEVVTLAPSADVKFLRLTMLMGG